ncbi:alpha/beta hydrolase [Treponema sp.]|uniref:alpha/beta hydrolase n=1 Tax=Treponema sp. TaxID=166 RepID=UPI00298E1F6F|nr:alpha/beta hydrolase-fold protein [Treponema sp.]MCQ2241646.1 hypothetical protein [Treponema sp.]
MSQLTVKYFSRCLIRNISFQVILPNDYVDQETEYTKRPIKTLLLLHGYTGDAGNWIPEEFANKYNFAIVIPNGENGFWLNGISTGHRFQSLIGEEIIGYIRKNFGLAKKREDTYIMGLSMGGFGALHTAFAYPETFGTTIALSSALIIKKITGMKPGTPDSHANYEYYRECFGDLEKVHESENNPEILVRKIMEEKKQMPAIYMACGTEDFLLENNRDFNKFLEDNKVAHVYWEDSGTHDMPFWDKCVRKFIPEIFG